MGPLDALKALAVQLASPASWGALWFSFGRISLGFFMAFLAGLLTGSLAFWKPLAGQILEPAIQFMKSVPVASFVILALIWTGAENLSVFISFLVVYLCRKVVYGCVKFLFIKLVSPVSSVYLEAFTQSAEL